MLSGAIIFFNGENRVGRINTNFNFFFLFFLNWRDLILLSFTFNFGCFTSDVTYLVKTLVSQR